MKRKLLLAALCVVGAVGMRAQTDVTDTYLVNPSFETGTVGSITELEGWVLPQNILSSDFKNVSLGSATACEGETFGIPTPSDGDKYFFHRKGWGNIDSELTTTTKTAVEAGTYYFVVDYKAADCSNNNNASPNGTAIGIKVTDASEDILAAIEPVKCAYSIANQSGSNAGGDTYMKTAPWTQKGIYFKVEEPSVLTFAFVQNMKNSGRSDIAYDNVRLYKIDDAQNLDFTGLIANPSFEAGNINGWTAVAGGDTGAKLNSVENYTMSGNDGLYVFNTWASGGTSYSVTQSISGLPYGKHTLSAIFAADENSIITLKAGESTNNYTATNKATGELSSVDFVYSSDAAIEIGATSTSWFKADNFKLTYLGPTVSMVAEALPADGAMEADTWYYFDIDAALAGDNTISAATLADVAYTTDGDVLPAEVNDAFDDATANLAEGRYYIKSASAQTFTYGRDATTYVENNDFTGCTNGNFPNWTIYAPNGGNTWAHGTTCVEYWIGTAANGVFDYYQEIEDLPVGKYTISASMWNTQEGTVNGECGVYGTALFSTVFKGVTIDSDDANLHTYTTDPINVIDGKLRLGVKNNTTMGARWFGVDWIKLTLVGDADLEALYAEVVAAADELGPQIPGAAMDALEEVITDNAEVTVESILNINDAVEAYTALVEPFAAYADAVDKSYAIYNQNVWTDKDDAENDYLEAMGAADTEVGNATTVAAIEEQISNVYAAIKDFIGTVQINADKYFDLTDLIVNPHFYTGTTANPTGWTIESGSVTELRNLTHNFEAYHRTFNLSQTITDLPKGTYKVTLQGFARHDNASVTDKTNLYCGISTQAIKDIKAEYSTTSYYYDGITPLGETNYDSSYELNGETVYQPNGMTGAYYWFQETNPLTGQPFYMNEVQALIPEAGDLKIGFMCETGNDWVIWDNFHLYYYGTAIDVTIDENVDGATYTENIENANVTLKRTFKDGVNTIVLPFDVEDVTDVFGDEAKVYVMGAFADNEITFAEQTKIEANVPCLLVGATASDDDTYAFDGVTIKAGNPVAEIEGIKMVGSYAASLSVAADGDAYNYIVYNPGEGDALYLVDSDNVVIKGTRAYFSVAAEAEEDEDPEAGAKIITISFEDLDGATAIAGIAVAGAENGAVYSISGQKVNAAYKGIVIKNGKKYLQK